MFGAAGQGWAQLGELTLAFGLSAAVGLEREFRQKSAGLRTYTLVGVSAALFMLISKYGFMDVLEAGRVVADPSRVAARKSISPKRAEDRRDIVRGLTTAASVWLTAALGMACGAGLPILAIATAIGHFVIMFVFPKLIAYLPRERRTATRLRISYREGQGLLQSILVVCTQLRFVIAHVDVERGPVSADALEESLDRADLEGVEGDRPMRGLVVLTMQVRGKRPFAHLVARLSEVEGVVRVGSVGDDAELE